MTMEKKVYIVGIEGAGTSALAVLYRRKGADVSGSDNGDHFYASALEREGIPVFPEFSSDQVPSDAGLVVYSTAFSENEEVTRARELGIPTLSYPEALAREFNDSIGIAVCGTHGKTTTSALLSHVLVACGLDPTAVIGGRVRDWGGNARVGSGKHFVLEADEYQDKLRFYDPWGVVLTSVDWDHPDFFPDPASYEKVFGEFVSRIPRHGILAYCNDSATVARIAGGATCAKRSYGFHEGSDIRIAGMEPLTDTGPEGPKQVFEIFFHDTSFGRYALRLPGEHNARNAAAVIAIGEHLKLDREKVRESLASFSGTARRFEYVGERDGGVIYDDYAHHPEEIRASLRAFRSLYPDHRILVLFHPHTFSRTRALLSEFAQSFDDADKVFLLDIYGSARERESDVSSDDLVREINRYVSGKAENVHSIDEAAGVFSGMIGKGDILVTLGAGNVWEVAKRLVG